MFTVEDFNSVLLSCKVNKFHSIPTVDIEGYGIVDMVKVKKTNDGFDFKVVDDSWTGGFYLTDGDGDYLSLTSSDYSFSDSVLSVATLESDVVLVLYCSSFFDEFRLEYLNCTLDSLTSVVNEVNVTSDDFTSLNGTDISDGDISVTGESIVCRGNHFYRGVVTVPTPIQFTANGVLYAGSPNATFSIRGYEEDMGNIIIEYDNTKRTIPPTSTTSTRTTYTITDIDLTKYTPGSKFNYHITYNHMTYKLTYNVSNYSVNSVEALEKAIELGVKNISFVNLHLSSDVIVNTPVTFTGVIRFEDADLIIADNTNVNFNTVQFNGVQGYTGGVVVGENTKTRFINCQFLSMRSTSIKANEDINNTDSSLLIENCTSNSCYVPMVVYDGELRITESSVSGLILTGSSVYEPIFVHMTGGRLTITDTALTTRRSSSQPALEGYNLCYLLFNEDTTFNGVPATEISKGNPSLQQSNITNTISVKYKNGDETINITDGFYVALEEKKIKNIKEDE